MDVVFYLLDAMQLFRGMSLEEVREIAFEIGILGRYELDINKPQGDLCPAGVAGEAPSPLLSCCASCTPAFKRIEKDRGRGIGNGSESGKREVKN
jgi:hypothetical protein